MWWDLNKNHGGKSITLTFKSKSTCNSCTNTSNMIETGND